MAKLTIVICASLLYVATTSGWSLRSQESSTQAASITKDEFQQELKDFSEVFQDASEAMGEVEGAVVTARGSGQLEVIFKFAHVIENDLAKLEPAVDNLGQQLVRIAESPDEFLPLPYCDSSSRLAAGKTEVTSSLDEARSLALLEDVVCFKGKLLKITAIDFQAFNRDEYTELQAFEQYWSILSEALQMRIAFERFIKALEILDNRAQNSSRGTSKRAEGNAQVAELARLLKQLKLVDTRK